MNPPQDPTLILSKSEVEGYPCVFVLGHHATQVTVYSQQVRALNLIWALNHTRPLDGKKVVVVGGGIAAVTAAAAAMLCGAQVTILEQGDELLHLQRGCHTRYLHPQIFEWPDGNARRASPGLPILNWSVGTASEVATRILADFHRIRRRLEASSGQTPFTEQCGVRGVSLGENRASIRWGGRKPGQVESADAIILTLGFGIEKTVPQLPRRSYWRVDSLTQTPLDSEDDQYLVLVSGTGDGGIIDVLRSALKEFDHSSFLDECVLRLEEAGVADQIRQIEDEANARWEQGREAKRKEAEVERELADWLNIQYRHVLGLKAVDELLSIRRQQTQVIWAGRLPCPVSFKSQPLNRVLGWRLWALDSVEYKPEQVERVVLLDQQMPAGYRYRVVLSSLSDKGSESFVDVHQVVIRHGSDSALKRWFPEIKKIMDANEKLKAIRSAERVRDVPTEVRQFFKDRYAGIGVRPSRSGWSNDIKIRAEPEWGRRRKDGKTVYRIRIWLESKWALGHVSWVEYDLHPEYGTITRRALWMEKPEDGQHFRHWVNTLDDYWIRVRCSDGWETGEWLSNAIDDNPGVRETDLAKQCVTNLRAEAKPGRPEGYHNAPWCNYVDPPCE
jgi:hypothetical protein